MTFTNDNLVYEAKKDGINITIDDGKANSFIGIREIRWNPDQPFKIDLRRYVINKNDEEVPTKGISFSTDEAVNRTVEELAAVGFGRTDKLMEILQNREDFDITSSTISTATSDVTVPSAKATLDSIFEENE